MVPSGRPPPSMGSWKRRDYGGSTSAFFVVSMSIMALPEFEQSLAHDAPELGELLGFPKGRYLTILRCNDSQHFAWVALGNKGESRAMASPTELFGSQEHGLSGRLVEKKCVRQVAPQL